MGNFEFSKYCTPAQLYLVLGAIGIGMGFFKNYGVETLLMKALFLVVWAWVLNWLCSKGFKAISWVLVLLPFIMMFFAYFFIKDVAKEAFEDEGFEDEGFFEGAKGKKIKVAKVRKPGKRTPMKVGFESFEGFEDEGFEDEGFEDEGFFEGLKKKKKKFKTQGGSG